MVQHYTTDVMIETPKHMEDHSLSDKGAEQQKEMLEVYIKIMVIDSKTVATHQHVSAMTLNYMVIIKFKSQSKFVLQ